MEIVDQDKQNRFRFQRHNNPVACLHVEKEILITGSSDQVLVTINSIDMTPLKHPSAVKVIFYNNRLEVKAIFLFFLFRSLHGFKAALSNSFATRHFWKMAFFKN